MSDRQFAASSRDGEEAGGSFAALEWARCVLLTTFERDGAAVSAPVRGVGDGDRAYFWAWSGSGSARRLRHDDAVQVTPCSMRGFFTYGSPLEATARLLPAAEAGQAAAILARKHPVRYRFLIPLLRRARRQQVVIYELLADDAAEGRGHWPEGFRAPGRQGGQSGGNAAHQNGAVVRIECVQTCVTDHGASSIACIWPASAQVPSPPADEAARRARSRAQGSTRQPAIPAPGTP